MNFLKKLFGFGNQPAPSKKLYKQGFIQGDGPNKALEPAELVKYPSGLMVVQWSRNYYKAAQINETHYALEENNYGFTKFIVAE